MDSIYIECKNLREAIGAKVIRDFITKLDERQASCGIILTRKGVTKGAKSVIKTYKAKGKSIIFLDENDIELLCQNLNITGILEKKILDI